MDNLKLTQIAQRHAALSGHGYAQGAGFVPHPWVIDAMREAAEEADAELESAQEQRAYDKGHAAGFIEGQKAGGLLNADK